MCALLFAATHACAGGAVVPPSPADSAAVRAANGFAGSYFRQIHHIEPKRVSIADRGSPVYPLSADLVRGAAGVPAGAPQLIAVTAIADGGERAPLRATPPRAVPGREIGLEQQRVKPPVDGDRPEGARPEVVIGLVAAVVAGLAVIGREIVRRRRGIPD